MAYTAEQLKQLQDLSSNYWWFQSEEFKNLVNTKMWEGSYDKLYWNLQTQYNDIKNKQNTANYNKQMENQGSIKTPGSQTYNDLINQWYSQEQIQNAVNNWGTLPWQKIDETMWWKIFKPINNTTLQKNISDTTTQVPKPVETPKPTQTQVQTPNIDWKNISIEDWKKQTWWWMQNLEQLVENKYWTIADIKWDTLTANIWWTNYQWKIDQAWNPIKTIAPPTTIQPFINKYANASQDEIYNWFINWEITKDIEWQLVNNPNYTIAKEKYTKKINTDISNEQAKNMYNTLTWQPTVIQDKLQQLSDKMMSIFTWMWKTENDLVSFQDYMAKNYPDIVSKSTELNAKVKRQRELQTAADNTLKNIENKYPWITKWTAILLANKENEAINTELKTLWFDISELSNNIQFQTNLADKNYSYLQQQQSRQDQLAQEQRWYMFNYLTWEQNYLRWLEQTQEERDYAQQQLQEQRAYETQQLADQRAYEERTNIATSIITDNATGKQKLINNKTWEVIKEYNTWLVPSKATESYELKEVWGKTYKINQVTWDYQEVWGTSWNIDKQTATSKYWTTPAVRNFNPWNIMDTGFGWQKVPWERFTVFNSPQEWFNALVAKIENIQAWNSKVYSPDMTLLQYISKYAPASDNNNPTAYANSIAKDLWVTSSTKIKDLDPVKLASAHAKHEDRNSYKMLQDLWIINADWTAWTWWTETKWIKQYTDEQVSDLAYVTELLEKTPTEWRKALKEMWYTDKDIANYKAWNVPLTDKQKVSSINVMEDIKDLVTNYDWNDATWVHFGMPVIAWTDRADTIQKIEQLVSKMTLPNLGSLKWPMSDKDLAFITKASSNLDVWLSDSQFEKNLIQAYNLAARRAWLKEVTSLKDIKQWWTTAKPQNNTWWTAKWTSWNTYTW